MTEISEIESVSSTVSDYPEPEETERRDRTRVSADVLRVCLSGAKRTRIVYQANLNFNILKTYLLRLITAGLLEEVGKLYYTTDAGKEFIYHAERVAI